MPRTPSNSAPANGLVLGDLIAAAFNHAEIVTADTAAAARLAARTVGRWLARVERNDLGGKLGATPMSEARRPHRHTARRLHPRAA